MDPEATFKSAFADPRHTALAFPPVDVNRVIRDAYETDGPFTYTRSQMWEMEVSKALHADRYLRHVLRPGSLRVFDRRRDGPDELFTRVTDQRSWKDPDTYATVVEHVCVRHDAQTVIFLGVSEAQDPHTGERFRAGEVQHLFHVEHAVSGAEDRPLNHWSIVYLTPEPDREALDIFRAMSRTPYLAPFIEVHIREDLGKRLVRKDPSLLPARTGGE